MTGSAEDGSDRQQPHPQQGKASQIRRVLKGIEASVQNVIVRDICLIAFDVPSLSTTYVDKPMRGHSLMQPIHA